MLALIVFIIILSVLVLVHEFGHFLVAKRLGIRVEEFGWGLPPRLFGKKVGETIYSVNLLPFGGFVRVTGEDLDEAAKAGSVTDPKSFASRSPWQRMAVLVAGVFMNMVLAVSLFYIVLGFSSFRTQYIPMIFDYKFTFGRENVLNTVVTAMESKSAAETSGIEVGDAILQIDGTPVYNVTDVRSALKGKLGKDVEVVLMDIRRDYNGDIRTIKIKPYADEKGNAVLGVYLSKAVSISYDKPWEKWTVGFLHSYNVLGYSVSSLSKLIGLSVATKTIEPVSESVAGPVGIYNVVGGLISYGGSHLVFNLLDFMALMSISLAFMNILPLPALDGGRVFFILIEKIKGSPFSPKLEAKLHQIGFVVLMGLLVLVTIKDVLH